MALQRIHDLIVSAAPLSLRWTGTQIDPDALHRQHPLRHHLVEDRHDLLDALRRVDDLDHHRHVLGEAEDPRGVEVRVGAEALDAAQHGCTGKTLRPDALDDRLVERLAVPRVRLADEEPQELSFALQLHSARPVTTPR